MFNIRVPAIERFWKKVHITNMGFKSNCWIWKAGISLDGYARFRGDPESEIHRYGHRWAYEHFIGRIPRNMMIDHLCRNRNCVNPSHLRCVTPKENVRCGALCQAELRNEIRK